MIRVSFISIKIILIFFYVKPGNKVGGVLKLKFIQKITNNC